MINTNPEVSMDTDAAVSTYSARAGTDHDHRIYALDFPFQIPATLTKQKVWVRLGSPIRLSGDETVSFTEILAQSCTELSTLRALVSATVGASYGPVSAEIKAEIETTRSITKTWSSERSHTRTVKREAYRMYADWCLIDRISIDFDLSNVEAGEFRTALVEATKKMRYYETYLATYQDDLADDEAVLANAFAEVQAVPVPEAIMAR